MGYHMKATIDIANSLLLEAKKLAARRNTTLKAVIETALAAALAADKQAPARFRLKLHTFKGNGLVDRLSWDDWAAIRSMSYEGRGG